MRKLINCISSLLAAIFVAGPPAIAQDISNTNLDAENEAQRDKILALLATHNLSWGAAWSPDPVFGFIAGAVAHQLNLGLKFTRPVLQEPADRARLTDSGDGCSYRLEYTHNKNEVYTDYLGLGPAFNPGAPRITADWGDFGQPTVFHGNSDVRVETFFNGGPFGIRDGYVGTGSIDLPMGRHSVTYEATTQISDLLDVPPWYALAMLLPVDVARKSLGRELLEAAIVGATLNYGPLAINTLSGLAGFGSIRPKDTFAKNSRQQRFYVLDTVNPVLTSSQPSVDIEALQVGGRVLTNELEAQIRKDSLSWSDRCRVPDDLTVQLVAPDFLPVGQDIPVVWRLRDPGPSSLNPAGATNRDPLGFDPDFPDGRPDDLRNEVRVEQIWRIRDTKPPIIEPPAGRVHESIGVVETVQLGKPAVFDLADPEASIVASVNGVPVETETLDLPNPSRTEITWTATDRSFNTARKTQWITIKGEGENRSPAATAGNSSAVSFEEIVIELFGQDTDLIDGRFDQLAFAIEEPPANGEFIAPLFPFFIEDYRVEANFSEDIQQQADTDGDGLVNPLERDALFRNWCDDPLQRQTPLPRNLVNEPVYIAVRDDGTSFVRDSVARCNQGDVQTDARIAQFDKDQNLVAELVGSSSSLGNVKSFWIASDGFIYYKNAVDDNVIRLDPTPVPDSPNRPPRMLLDVLDLKPPPDVNGVRSLRDIRSVAVDSNDLLYVTDGAAVYVFDTTQLEPNRPNSVLFVGDLVPRGEFTNDASTNAHMDTAIDSMGNIYFSDEELERVWKYSASTLDRSTNEFTPGTKVGWLGRCTGNRTAEPACDTQNERSFGFSCTDALCIADTSPRDVQGERNACGMPQGNGSPSKRGGCQAGQFDRPRGIAINDNDIIYVADFNNFRIQRFNTDGMFGGEARSECDGTCFVLGDFGKPVDVSVNKTHFYVLDTEFDLLHVFETTPITNVEDANLSLVQNAFVTYRSNNNFRGTDSFSFTVSDGLANSSAATVSVDVSRNFRAPEAISTIRVETLEEQSVDVTLIGTDADEDALVYTVTSQPANGILEGAPPNLRYTPNEDFEGIDSFAFVVDDSLSSVPAMTSEPATVTVEVLPAPDDPTLEIQFAENTGVAYEAPFAAYSYDPDVGDKLSITVDWGDGTPPEPATRNTSNAGGSWPTLFTDDSFEAHVEAKHQFPGTGIYTVTVCVADNLNGAPLPDCNSPDAKTVRTRTINVEELAELVVFTDDDLQKVEDPQCPQEAVNDGSCPLRSVPLVDSNTITYTTTVHHIQLGDITRDARDLLAHFEFPAELQPIAVTYNAPGATAQATINGREVDVRISALAVNSSAEVSVTATTPGNLAEDRVALVSGNVSSNVEDPSGRNPILARTIIVMNPEGDADGDGVLNKNDAFPGDPTESVDLDSDGIGDNADLDDDGDRMADKWEQRFGFDPRNAGDGDQDADNDGLSNADEFLSKTRPDLADSDFDALQDGADNCAATFNVNQFDMDSSGAGDVCDRNQFAAVADMSDIDSSGAADYALIRTDGGIIEAFVKDGVSNFSIGANTITLGQSDADRVAGVSGIPGNVLAAILSDTDGLNTLRTWSATSGADLGSAEVFDGTWSVTGVSALDRDAGARVLISASHPDGRVAIEQREPGSAALLDSETLMTGHDLLDVAVTSGGLTYAVLVVEQDTGMLELSAHDSASNAALRQWTIAGSDWVTARVAGAQEEFAVIAQNTSGEIQATVFSATSDTALASFSVLDNSWAALDLVMVDSSAIAVMVADTMGEIRILVLDSADGSTLSDDSYHSSSETPRAMSATVLNNAGEVGVLAANQAGAVTLELRSSDGGNSRIVTAEATAPPPPPPAPPVTPPPSGESGGGGAFDYKLLILLLVLVGLRRKWGLSPLQRKAPSVKTSIWRM